MNLTVTTRDFCTMATLFALIKEWIPFAFLGVGAILSVFGFFQMKRMVQDNTLKILNNFKVSLQAHDLSNWKELYLGTSDAASPPAGYFLNQTGQFVALDTMWTAGNTDHTAVQRMAESLEKVCVEILKPGVNIKSQSELPLDYAALCGVTTTVCNIYQLRNIGGIDDHERV